MGDTARRGAALLLALVSAGPALAQQDPLSAIDWLSDSVAMPVVAPMGIAPRPPEAPVVRSALPQSVSVEPLDRPDPAGAGILRPEAVGLPRDPWMGASGQAVIAALPDDPVTLLPASRRLLVTLLSVEQTPPATDSAAFLLARIDTLLSMGQLPRAASLMEAAGLTDPDIFRRWFDAELLTNNGNRACSRLRSLPDISPTYSARIFCLARGGDWHAAALTLKTGEALNVISSDDSALLARFLDVDLFEDMPPLQIPATPTPLTFAMFEAIGQSIPTARLPLAFAHTDLRTIAGWKARLEAAERLAAPAHCRPSGCSRSTANAAPPPRAESGNGFRPSRPCKRPSPTRR